MNKICLFGGTFDPIHIGHINMANTAYLNYGFDNIIFIPTGNSYLKSNVTEASHRFNMTNLAIARYDYFEISDYEIKHDGPSYTFETIQYFSNKYKKDELYFLLGEDSIRYIDKWKNPDIIFDAANVIVAKRASADNIVELDEVIKGLKETYNASIEYYNFDEKISSTELRGFLKNKDYKMAEEYMDKNVIEYILDKKLYQ